MKAVIPDPKSTKVLIVEDEVIAAESIASKLRKQGYTVLDIVDNASLAIECAGSQHPDIILMDIMLKGDVDGISAAEIIYQELQIPVIYMTAFADVPTVERAKNTYPFGYVVKPFRLSELIAVMEIALKQHHRLAKLEAIGAERSDLLSLLVREFRNPLSTIIVTAEMLELKGDQWSKEERAKRLQRITTATQTLSQLIEDVVIAARSEASNFQPELADFNVVHFCSDFVQELQNLWSDSLQIQYLPFLYSSPTVHLDCQWLSYILSCYLNTVAKFCSANSSLGAIIKFSVAVFPSRLEITINPEGVVLSDLMRQPISSPFTKNQHNTGKGSASLELAIANRLITAQNGTIDLEDHPQQGTVIVINLPLQKAKSRS
jgi:K+-sensing histidine kinase KdpD